MDIKLNTTSEPQVGRNIAKVAQKCFSGRSAPCGDLGFAFSFGGKQHKVKAIVARKRSWKMTPLTIFDKDHCSNTSLSLSEHERDVNNTSTSSANGTLLLNITTDPNPSTMAIHQSKQKLSRFETLRTKGKTFKEPMSCARLCQNINKDRQKRFACPGKFKDKSNQEEIPAAAPCGDHGGANKVNAEARKANAFRIVRPCDKSVKKVGLFSQSPATPFMGQRFVKPIAERIFDGTKIDAINIHPHTVKNLEDNLSIVELTTVQKKTIPLALEGKDLLVRAQTGSGKTLAYALPVIEKLQEVRPKITRNFGVLAVVVVPIRELAIQTYELFQTLLKPFTWIVPGVLMGGEKRKAEKARIRKGINILIGTPGRLVDHLLHTESFTVDKTRFLVLDEADRLLEMGYERDVRKIVEAIDGQRANFAKVDKSPMVQLQRILLSATLTASVQRLAGLMLQEPIFVDNSQEDSLNADECTNSNVTAVTSESVNEDERSSIITIPENLKLNFVVVPPKLRLVTLSAILAKEFTDKRTFKAIIFMSTMEMVNFHYDLLKESLTHKVLDEDDEIAASEKAKSDADEQPLLKNLRFFKLHGSMTQTERYGVFNGIRECMSGILLATDVAGRGIDVPAIDLVIQYSPPQNIADFVHRVGRTARGGHCGDALLFLTPSETQFVRFLEEQRIRISQLDMEIYLKHLNNFDCIANTMQEAASNLQHKFQELIADDEEMHTNACKAFVSWAKFYSTFSKGLKPFFNIKNTHMGHFAKSFGLKDQPKSFAKKYSEPKPPPPTNRLTYTERDPEKMKIEKRAKKRRFATTVANQLRDSNASLSNKLANMLPASRALTTSEFDSGLPALKKRKKS